MDKWLRERLSVCLDFEVPDDMIKYILSMKKPDEFDEYFETLLNKDCEDHRLFLVDCKQRLFSKALPNKKSQSNQPSAKKAQGHGSAQIKQNVAPSTNAAGKQAKQETTISQQNHQGTKKKTKFVSLYANDGNVIGNTIMLKGRRICECQASQHKLINNCLGCGRIVCEQEGSGPCLFCGEIVCTNAEMEILKSTNKKSENLLKSLREKGGGESLKKAMEQRDRLLEYDRNSEKRTTVIDDELDYFQENSVWLTDEERKRFDRLKEEMHEKKHAGRAKRNFKIDFAGREIEELPISEAYEQKVLKEIAITSAAANESTNWSNRKHSQKITSDTCDTDPNLEALRPIYRATAEEKGRLKLNKGNNGLEQIYNRVQDKELLEMQDLRQCLSMHQPWASLLVAGIKKHEGRVWYSEHRGRLWIASTVKDPNPEEIQEIEKFYKSYYDDPNLKFPEHYPTGCLLGCVKIEDCLPQETYREIHPGGESVSPYVFICSNPEQLPVVFPIKGQQKIYSIDPKIHNAACKALLRINVSKN